MQIASEDEKVSLDEMTPKFHIELFNDYMTRALVYRHKAENVDRVRQEHDRASERRIRFPGL